MNAHFWFMCIVLIMYNSWITRGFLLDKSTLAPQSSGGSVITNVQFLSLIELIADEKRHRYQLEQKVAELEKHQASIDQDSNILKLEIYIKRLEQRLSMVEQTTASLINNTRTCLADNGMSNAIANLSKRTFDIELKYNGLETNYNEFYNTCNTTDQQLDELKQEIVDLRNIMNVNHLSDLELFAKGSAIFRLEDKSIGKQQ
ncbi:unnamed protein product [Mytilus coruscus]|uniref:Uncharacterized protein n=1 Tax=Mytilus coruscus TaxID=42192 RepID=A0A6J8EBH8_MYTCO|nr:unnamed protein product [Mytilus coruscus]